MVDNDEADVLDGITTFVAVAETLGFRAAAERLGVTPAAVSRAVQRLEARVGVRLLARTTRRVGLTREGERFAARCREAVAQLRLGHEELHSARTAPRGTLALSASPILSSLVVRRLARFVLRHPAVRVELRLTDRIVPFAEGGVDVGLRVGPIADETLVARALVRPRWVTVASPGYLARRGTPRSVAELSEHDCLRFLPPRGKPRPWTFRDHAGKSVAFEPRGSLDVDIGGALLDAAIADVGVAQVLDFMIDHQLRDGRLVELLGDMAAPGPVVHAVHPRGAVLPRVRAYVDFMQEELRGRIVS